MRLARLRLSNFRCFGHETTTIELDRVTALLGSNGSGKTAVLQALARLFGTTQAARTLSADDFHVPLGQKRDSADSRSLVIEADLEFACLCGKARDGGAAAAATARPSTLSDPGVPAFFEQMAITREGGTLFCRMRLTGTWTKTALADGTVESELEWLRSADDDPADEFRSKVSPIDRDRVRVHYVPAFRDATRQLSAGPGGLLQQLLRAIDWDDEIRAMVYKTGEELRSAFAGHRAVARLNDAAATHWEGLYDEWLYRKPSLSVAARQIEEAVRSAHMVFGPSHEGGDHTLDRLSDGQQSLFYFAFMGTIFDIQRESYLSAQAPSPSATPQGSGFAYDRLKPAALTLFAIEEPENHLAPHYLGRIVTRLTGLVEQGGAQIVLASHAPAVLARIEPEAVRHLRCDSVTHEAQVNRLLLPGTPSEADRYIREAVRGFPELYFARAVVLCEGDSEEGLIPRFARVLGTDLDLAFVSVVPLGGRHVNHFWRLLTGLGIPFVTLLDLDCERGTGGWARIKYVVTQLLVFLPIGDHARLLAGPSGGSDALGGDEDVTELGKRDAVADSARMLAWVKHLRKFGVFFSAPLDIDFMMLEAFDAAYRATVDGEPRLDEYEAVAKVLGKDASGASYTVGQRQLFPWYNYLFLGRGKPSTHTAAWVSLDAASIREKIPEPIGALFSHIRMALTSNVLAPVADRLPSSSTTFEDGQLPLVS